MEDHWQEPGTGARPGLNEGIRLPETEIAKPKQLRRLAS